MKKAASNVAPLDALKSVLFDLKLGQGVEVESPWPGLGKEKVLLICQEITPRKKVFAASYYGIEIGPLVGEFVANKGALNFVEDK